MSNPQLLPRPLLVRSTRQLCEQCSEISTSLYEHRYCYNCAPHGTPAFRHHKETLNRNALRSYPALYNHYYNNPNQEN